MVVSKPPAAEVAASLREYAATLATPVEFALLGPGQPDLTAAAESALRTLGREVPAWPVTGSAAAPAGGRLLRGLFVGGTLCDESMLVATAALGPIRSNIPLVDRPGPRRRPRCRAGGRRAHDGRLRRRRPDAPDGRTR